MRSGVPSETEATTGEIDLSGIGRALARKRWWVIGPTLVAFVGAFAFVNLVKPRYTSDAKLLLENQDSFFTRVDKGERVAASEPDAEDVQSQIQLLTSRDLARRVIKQLGLQGNQEFDPLANGVGALTRVMVLLGIVRDPTRMSPEDRILEKFGEKLAVLSPTKTRVLSIEFSSRDPDLAARGANAVADAYIEMQQEAKRDLARSAAQSLATLVSDLHTRVAEAEAKVEDYRAKTGLLVGSNNTVIPTQQLGELNNQLSIARGAQADAQAKANLLRDMLRQNRIGEIPDVANNEVMRRIFEQRVALRAQLALESRTLLPQHPRIKELNAQLSDLDMQWRAAAERTAHTLENDARIASARVENLTRALEDQKRVAGAAGSEEVKLRDLERGARLLKDQLEAETAKYQEAVARERVKATPADARIIQRALAPQIPSFPKKIPITAFATLAAFILSAGAVVAGELLSGRARMSSRDLAEEDAPETPPPASPAPAGPAPAGGPAPAKTIDTGWRRSDADALRRIESARAVSSCVKVLVTPCETGGKPIETAIALGRSLARRGRTLLVAADAGVRSLDALVHSPGRTPKGLSDLLTGGADFAEAIHRDIGSRLHVMPGGVAEGAERDDLSLVVAAVAHTYDFVVFAASATQALDLAWHVDLAFVLGGDATAEALRATLAEEGADAHLLEDAASVDELAA
ncbi:exopolysaccharide transport family protein [Methylocystis sp. Sn-Cys]|uniref:GumC family protein n=1 Tax=Methylocystis sp. Sn-Cys TaxID=1701263 RepID=UPI001921789E|nr:exopolysaccharide transport family protein [Methylocystis sp. Sn-Cys]MBL1258079.1 lipopolysaccharide biosynthesis protein [Methylocystis sp. Sn-Cys]